MRPLGVYRNLSLKVVPVLYIAHFNEIQTEEALKKVAPTVMCIINAGPENYFFREERR